MIFAIYLIASAIFLAHAHAQYDDGDSDNGTVCNYDYGNAHAYVIESQEGFDGIERCQTVYGDPGLDNFTAINGDIIISSEFNGVLDFGDINAVMGMVSAVNATNFTGISGQNLMTIGQSQSSIGILQLQNLDKFNSLDLPLLNFAKAIVLSNLEELKNLSLPGFLSYGYNTTLFDRKGYYENVNLTVSNVWISRIEGFNMSTMDTVTLANNSYLTSVDLSSLSEVGGNLIVSNNDPSLDLDISNLNSVGGLQLSSVQTVNISSLQYAEEGIELIENTFSTIDFSALISFGNGGLVVKDNPFLLSLDSLRSTTNKDNNDDIGPNTFIYIFNNPKLIITTAAFESIGAVNNITITATINSTYLFGNLYLNAYSSFIIINITSINPPESDTTFSCASLDQKMDTLWVDENPYTSRTPPKNIYTCASYTSTYSSHDIAKHYTPKTAHKGIHLSAGAKAGVAIGIVAAVAILAALAYRKVRAKRPIPPKPIEEDGDELPEYTRHAPDPPAYQGADGAAAYFAGRSPAPDYERGLAGDAAGGEAPPYVAGEGGRGVADHGERTGLVAGEGEGEGYRVSEESERDVARRGDGRVSLESARPVSGRG